MIELVGGMLTQWDVDRSVEIADALSVDEVHFANEGDSVAVKIPVTDVDGKKTAAIPNYLLQSGKSVRAYGVNGGVTVKVVSFPVRKRERPEDYVYEDDQRNYIYRLISDAQDATEKANAVAEELYKAKENGELNGPPGPPGPKGDPGDSIEPLIVTLDEDTGRASHTATEIYNHNQSGGAVFVTRYGYTYPFSRVGPYQADFVYTDWVQYTIHTIIIRQGGQYELVAAEWVSSSLFYDTIGDISSALDELHNYAQRLIDGGATE